MKLIVVAVLLAALGFEDDVLALAAFAIRQGPHFGNGVAVRVSTNFQPAGTEHTTRSQRNQDDANKERRAVDQKRMPPTAAMSLRLTHASS